MKRTELGPDGLTDTQYAAWDWLDFDAVCTVEDSPFKPSTWKAMEKKGWVKLVEVQPGRTRIMPQ